MKRIPLFVCSLLVLLLATAFLDTGWTKTAHAATYTRQISRVVDGDTVDLTQAVAGATRVNTAQIRDRGVKNLTY